jgi:hypothetical protein
MFRIRVVWFVTVTSWDSDRKYRSSETRAGAARIAYEIRRHDPKAVVVIHAGIRKEDDSED